MNDKSMKVWKILFCCAVGVIIIYSIITMLFSESGKRWVKDVDSELSGGLNRTLWVYDYNGDLIKTYTGKIDIEASDVSGKVKFDMDGKRTIIYGGIVIVDEQ